MPAPNGTIWGPESNAGEYPGKLGIYSSVKTTSTHVTIDVEVWVWSKYSCDDTNNKLYFNVAAGITDAITERGSVTINTTSNVKWSEKNQQCIYGPEQFVFTRDKIGNSYSICARLTKVEYAGDTTTVSANVAIPPLESYVIAYDLNGGKVGPVAQTKYYGKDLELSGVKPKRDGYTFLGWSTTNGGSAEYSPGATYKTNAPLTLYAVWARNTFVITFNANGGENAPASISKKYKEDVTLPEAVPSKEHYNFVGWAKSQYATSADYSAGGNFTENASVTLYAVWELGYVMPIISNVKATRCTEDGIPTDDGTYAKVSFDWECYVNHDDDPYSNYVTEIGVGLDERRTDSQGEKYWYGIAGINPEASGTSGTVSEIIGLGQINPDCEYRIGIFVGDRIATVDAVAYIPACSFPIDVLKGGKGLGFGCPATDEGKAKFAYELLLNRGDGVYTTLIDLIYPIGSVITLYPKPDDLKDGKFTEDCDMHPKKLYPGTTWERIEEKFLWAASGGGKIGHTGGSQEKTITKDNLPEHDHGATYTDDVVKQPVKYAWYTATGEKLGYEAVSVGGNEPLNIMPPYVQVAMFRRVD